MKTTTTTTRNKLSRVLFLVVSFSLSLLQPAASDLVQTTCQQTPYYQLCVSTFKTDPRSATADVAGLAVVGADKVKDKSSSTMDQIKSLLPGTQVPTMKQALNDCLDLHKTIVSADVPEIIEAVTKGDPKFAQNAAADAAHEADICEMKVGRTSPLSDSNGVVHDLSLVVEAIVKLLL